MQEVQARSPPIFGKSGGRTAGDPAGTAEQDLRDRRIPQIHHFRAEKAAHYGFALQRPGSPVGDLPPAEPDF